MLTCKFSWMTNQYELFQYNRLPFVVACTFIGITLAANVGSNNDTVRNNPPAVVD